MSALNQLFTPVAYLRIRQKVKPLFDWFFPLSLAIILFFLILMLPEPVRVFGDRGLIFAVTDLIKLLIGFYIAALAAVATFQNRNMDKLMEGAPATLGVKRKGKLLESKLSRRRFLCYLFGYLAFLGLALYFVGSASLLLEKNLLLVTSTKLGVFIKHLFVFVYLFFVANLLTTTLLGLHFLTDRIHR